MPFGVQNVSLGRPWGDPGAPNWGLGGSWGALGEPSGAHRVTLGAKGEGDPRGTRVLDLILAPFLGKLRYFCVIFEVMFLDCFLFSSMPHFD